MLKRLLLLLMVIGLIHVVQAQTFNRPVPGDYYPYEFEDFGETPGLFIANGLFELNGANDLYYASLIDGEGYIAWYHGSPDLVNDLQFWSDHGVFTFFIPRGGSQIDFYRMDQSFNLIDSVTAVGSVTPDGHEFILADNGNRLILTQSHVVMDLSGYSFNGLAGNSATTVRSNGIQEFDDMGNLVFEWQSTDHIHPSEFINGYNYYPTDFDYAHANSISEDLDGHLLVSFRHLDAVYKIHRTTGEVIWSLGGMSSDFTFSAGSDWFSGQHTARRTWDGDLGLFDNGNRKPVQQTRVVKYDLDTINWIATETFSYVGDQLIYSPGMGAFQNYDEDLMSIGWGRARWPEPTISVLNGQGELQKRIIYQDFVMSYRSWAGYLPFQLPRPEVTCDNGPNGIELTAPSGSSNYLWSTGETTQTITVADTGTYMVWVEHGIGMVGSQPYYLNDLSEPCGITTVLEELNKDADKETQFFDLNGRRVESPSNGADRLIRKGKNGTAIVLPID